MVHLHLQPEIRRGAEAADSRKDVLAVMPACPFRMRDRWRGSGPAGWPHLKRSSLQVVAQHFPGCAGLKIISILLSSSPGNRRESHPYARSEGNPPVAAYHTTSGYPGYREADADCTRRVHITCHYGCIQSRQQDAQSGRMFWSDSRLRPVSANFCKPL